ncbi:MAG: RNA polymerase sigma factor [Candidatus Dormibacteria bacterium]
MAVPRDEEEQLVRNAQDNPEAFGKLYDHYVDQMYRYIYSRVHSHEVAEDITSEVFFKALRAIGRYKPSGSPFSAWLYQISSNAITDYYRSHHVMTPIDDAIAVRDPARPVSDEVTSREEARRIWGFIDTLPPQQRTALTLKLGEDLKLSQIGEIMGKSEGAVKLLIHRGMTTLKGILQAHAQEEGTPT